MKRLVVILACVAAAGSPSVATAGLPPVNRSPEATVSTATVSGLRYELKQFTRWRTERVQELAARTEDGVSGDLVQGLYSRETNHRNIVGGGFFNNEGTFIVTGADRGLGQINEVYHENFLRSIPGCNTGEYKEVYTSAYPDGRVPGLTRGTEYSIYLLRERIIYVTQQGVPADDAVRVAVAAYNAGTFYAMKGYQEGDPDKYTTGGDYSADVLDRRTKVRRARRALGW